MKTVPPVSKGIEKRSGYLPVLSLSIVLIMVVCAFAASIAFGATEEEISRMRGETICRGYYVGSGEGGPSKITYTLTVPTDLQGYSVQSPVEAITAIVNARSKRFKIIKGGNINRVTEGHVVCPLRNGEVEIIVRETK